jgi:hypothetical protein
LSENEIEGLKRISEHEFKFDFTKVTSKDTNLLLSQNAVVTVNGNNKFIIATDCDECLINISDKWVQTFFGTELHNYITDDHRNQMTMNGQLKVMSSLWRDKYYLNEWLSIKDPTHFKEMMDNYYNDPNFYDNLVPSPLFDSIEKMGHLISEIHIITACGSDINAPANKSKAKYLVNLFKELELKHGIIIKIHLLKSGESKGEFLKNNGIKFNLFIDDHVENIIDVINHTEYSNYELMVPAYGYNQDLFKKIKESNPKYEFKTTLFHNTHDYSQTEIIDAIAKM